jgi:tight adherence protein B
MKGGIVRYRTAVASAVVVGMLSLQSAPVALAADSSSLEVVSVSGLDVTLQMKLDPTIKATAESAVTGTVEVAGVVVPASTSLTVPESPPKVAILVLDASGSMKGRRMSDARAAAKSFAQSMPDDVKVGLVAFNKSVNVLAEPTLDRATVISAIDATTTGGKTSFYDGIKGGLELVPTGTQARLLVLSDGQDTASSTTLDEISALVSASATPVDVVGLKPSPPQVAILDNFANSSGGTLRTSRESAGLAEAFNAASESYRATVTLRASLPPGVDASRKPITATVAVDGAVAEATTTLPTVIAPAAPSASAAVAAGGGAPATLSASGGGLLVPLLLALVVFGSVAFIGWAVVTSRHRRRSVERVEQILEYETRSPTAAARAQKSDADPSRFPGLDALLARRTNARRVRIRLAAAGFTMTPAEWLVLRLVAALVVGLLLALLVGSLFLGLLLGCVVVWLVARTVLRSRSARRQRAFADELSDFLMLLASGIRAGLSFTHALNSAAEDAKGEMGRQMRRVLREVSVGAGLDVALLDCADRMDNEDLRWMVTAMSIQREVGGNLSTILDGVARTIKGRDELRREIRTLSAEGRLSGYVLIALPLLVFAFLAIFRTEYVAVFWSTPLGILMLIALTLAIIVGWLWMRALVRIKV